MPLLDLQDFYQVPAMTQSEDSSSHCSSSSSNSSSNNSSNNSLSSIDNDPKDFEFTFQSSSIGHGRNFSKHQSKEDDGFMLLKNRTDFGSNSSWSNALNHRGSSRRTSRSIPIRRSRHIQQQIEQERLQSMEDDALVAYRDYCMYARLLNGIDPKKNPEIWNNIVQTRHSPLTSHERSIRPRRRFQGIHREDSHACKNQLPTLHHHQEVPTAAYVVEDDEEGDDYDDFHHDDVETQTSNTDDEDCIFVLEM